MSVSQWKLLNQIREYISKLNDKSAQAAIQKEFQYIARRLPHLQQDVLKYFSYNESEKVADKEVAPQTSKYNLPNVLETLKKKNDAPEMPRWKCTAPVVSKVRRMCFLLNNVVIVVGLF